MKITAMGAACAAFLAAAAAGGAARAQDVKETICAQGTYSTPCPQIVWCPGENCGIGIPKSDGQLEIIYSSEEKMDGTTRRPIQAGTPMALQNLIGKLVVFEWENSGAVGDPGSDLAIKDIIYVIMAPQSSG